LPGVELESVAGVTNLGDVSGRSWPTILVFMLNFHAGVGWQSLLKERPKWERA